MTYSKIFFIPKTRNIDLAIAPSLTDQRIEFVALSEVVFHTQPWLKQRYVCIAGAVRLAHDQIIGPDSLLVLQGKNLTVVAVIAASLNFCFGKTRQTEHALRTKVNGMA